MGGLTITCAPRHSRIYTQSISTGGAGVSLQRVSDDGRLEQLTTLRDILAVSIDECESSRDLAALSRQYRETIREIESIESGEDDGDEIASIILRHRKPNTD